MKQNAVETLTGAIVIVIAGAFLFFLYTTTGFGGAGGGYTVTAAFNNLGGVNTGSDVRISGLKVGSVTGHNLDETYEAVLALTIDSDVKLPDDSTAKITSEGLLGSSFVAIEPGGSETLLKNGDQFQYTQPALDLWSIIGSFVKPSGGSSTPATPAPAAPEATPQAEPAVPEGGEPPAQQQ
ncbi:phospholipid/cholesterol/gamma-HCH transport system substrate-binding protein [Rhodoligotrophos appendicifer]|uniref:outer membrane lipid asymmetry maintenance protein MlaD n=1 Tax=Rhodoligotrophos appendicifer TaxID=987056 RepID=UPI001478B990|nr:outer membrane lipid asymmetry maintenance protein MlaD [Rhodoligotrophos appendicifer]